MFRNKWWILLQNRRLGGKMRELAKIIVGILLAIMYGFIIKYCGTDLATICLLININAHLITNDGVREWKNW